MDAHARMLALFDEGGAGMRALLAKRENAIAASLAEVLREGPDTHYDECACAYAAAVQQQRCARLIVDAAAHVRTHATNKQLIEASYQRARADCESATILVGLCARRMAVAQ